jgi:hypothetical protein
MDQSLSFDHRCAGGVGDVILIDALVVIIAHPEGQGTQPSCVFEPFGHPGALRAQGVCQVFHECIEEGCSGLSARALDNVTRFSGHQPREAW